MRGRQGVTPRGSVLTANFCVAAGDRSRLPSQNAWTNIDSLGDGREYALVAITKATDYAANYVWYRSRAASVSNR